MDGGVRGDVRPDVVVWQGGGGGGAGSGSALVWVGVSASGVGAASGGGTGVATGFPGAGFGGADGSEVAEPVGELTRQLDTGRVEMCDLPAVTAVLDAASAAINRYLLF